MENNLLFGKRDHFRSKADGIWKPNHEKLKKAWSLLPLFVLSEVFGVSRTFGINALSGEIPKELGLLTNLLTLCPLGPLFNDISLIDVLRAAIFFVSSSSICTSLGTNNFSGPLPPELGNLTKLTQIYFNSVGVTGPIPLTFAKLQNLEQVRFEGNAFEGPIPASFSNLTSLTDLDLSFNNLTGRIPDAVFNLNSLTHLFAIKCGGPQITSTNQILYERDTETLGPATYFMTSTGRWAVSNAGLHSDRPNQSFTSFSSSQFTNTLDSELFQTARISAGSLRYYGLGLGNGNYTVNLQFAESEILNPPTWRSVGRRVFDVYVQGNRELKDFDIRKEAGGRSLVAVQKQFKAQVSENHLEMHLFWAGKGTCCVPIQGTNQPPTTKKNRTGLIVGIVVGVGVISFISVFAVYYLIQKRKQQALEDEEFLGIDTRPYTFSYSELRAATGDFCSSNKLGEGGFGPVYKGTLEDGRVVAVKQLSVASHQGKSQFVAEIATISAVQHRNLVKLHGCCIEADRRLLVYEYLENKSLDQALFARILNSIFKRWGISATNQCNISGELCSGAAIDSTSILDFNPAIKCDCSNRTACSLACKRVSGLNVRGEIPDELWSLTFLNNLSIGINALSGELPKELGLLTDIMSIYIDSSGVSGPIPLTFAKMQNLDTVWASDNDFTGRIPDFIGNNCSKLTALRFQGNAFAGPIPASFSNLTSLTDLVLRDNNISGSIPPNIGKYQNLSLL
ncbi:hypothetical protein RND71_024050 [Anisodus tanguticus]|uniref:non-specific serine/threonine protein kinase n=1 Tax=Anisodus tanguticus TaxID=243964 RepID=A0AAE1RMD7_9SOLA|nr:hypothetical protein RND71_024050 [Anisodus tanguticus]